MSQEGFEARARLQFYSQLIASGDELLDFDSRTPSERFYSYNSAICESLEAYRKAVLATDWESMTQRERDAYSEKLLKDYNTENFRLLRLAFQVGLCTGIELGQEIHITAEMAGHFG